MLRELHFFFEEGYDPFEPLEMKKLTEREQFILDRVVFAYGTVRRLVSGGFWRAAKHPGATADQSQRQKQPRTPDCWIL